MEITDSAMSIQCGFPWKTPYRFHTTFNREGSQVWPSSLLVTWIMVICVLRRCVELTSIKDAFRWRGVCVLYVCYAVRTLNKESCLKNKLHNNNSFMDFSYVTTECWHGRWFKGRSLGIFLSGIYCHIWLLGYYLYDNITALEYESVLIAPWHGNMFPHYYTFVRWSHRSPVNFPHQWLVMRGLSSVFFILYNLENKQSNSLCFFTSWRPYGATLFSLPLHWQPICYFCLRNRDESSQWELDYHTLYSVYHPFIKDTVAPEQSEFKFNFII